MQPRTRKHLADLEAACLEILELVSGDSTRIQTERIIGLAVERLLLIVGEALVRIRDDEPAILEQIEDWQEIVGMRNAIVHGYDRIDAARVADAVRDDVPALLEVVRSILKEG